MKLCRSGFFEKSWQEEPKSVDDGYSGCTVDVGVELDPRLCTDFSSCGLPLSCRK